jgi:YD repeat-containing protein
MGFSARGVLLPILAFLAGFAANGSARAEYWRSVMPDYQYIICSDGFSCARTNQAAYYGTNLVYGACYYTRNSYGQIAGVICDGWKNQYPGPYRAGISKLYCDAGEVKASEGCVAAPPPRKDVLCNTTAGNPVDTTSGMKLEYALDFTTAGPIPLRFERHYRSSTDTMEGYFPNRLGRGWRSNFDASIHVQGSSHPATNIRFVMPDGTFYAFYKTSGAYVQRYYSWSSAIWRTATVDRYARASWNSTLQRYELTTDDDTVWSFDTSARLQSIVLRGGYTQTLAYDAAGNNSSVTDSFGRTLNFTYTANGLLDTIQTPDGRIYSYDYLSRYIEEKAAGIATTDIDKSFFALEYVTYPDETPDNADDPRVQYHYENSGYPYALTGITDENAIRYATWTYDSEGRVTRSEHAGSADIHDFSYAGTATTVTNPLGKNTVYRFDTDLQNRNRLTHLEGVSSANCAASDGYYTYNSSNFVTQKTDEEGHITKYTRDTRGNPTQIIEAYGTSDQRTTAITWDTTYDLATRIVETGRTIALAYDSYGRLTSRTETDTTTQSSPYSTNGETRSWTYSYSSLGLLLSVDGPLEGTGDTTTYVYDGSGYLASITDEMGLVTTIGSVTANGYPAKLSDANGVTWQLNYDARNRLTTVTTDAGGPQESTATISYDALGQVTRITLGDGSYSAYAYDSARRVTSITNALGEEIAFSYDAMGNATRTEVKSGAATTREIRFGYDELGRLLRSIGALGQTTAYSYDRLDDLTSVTDPRGNSYHYAYDALKRVIKETDKENADIALARDVRDEIISHTDPKNVATNFVRNGFGEIIQESSPDIGTIVYRRNGNGDVTERPMLGGRSLHTAMITPAG